MIGFKIKIMRTLEQQLNQLGITVTKSRKPNGQRELIKNGKSLGFYHHHQARKKFIP